MYRYIFKYSIYMFLGVPPGRLYMPHTYSQCMHAYTCRFPCYDVNGCTMHFSGCSNLPLCEGGKPPTTQVSVRSFANPSDSHPLATLFKSEVIEVNRICTMHVQVMVALGHSCGICVT